jgi:hypothetical protein
MCLDMLYLSLLRGCSAEVAAAARERQVVCNRQQLRDTLDSKQKGSSEQEAGGWHNGCEVHGYGP